MSYKKQTRLVTAIQLALAAGITQTAMAQPFEPEIFWIDLDGRDGITIVGEFEFDQTGSSVGAAGDINGDGVDDLIIGARYASPIGSLSGRSYVIFGSASGLPGSIELSALNGTNGFSLNGEDSFDLAGESVSGAGDFNHDGRNDLIIGAPELVISRGGFDAGRSYLVFGSSSAFASPFNLSNLNGLNGNRINGESAADFSGTSVSFAGDINDDGIDDVIIGAPAFNANGFDSGRSYVVFGSASGINDPFALNTLNGSNGFTLDGESGNDRSGFSVSRAGDINGDGIDDLVIGAPDAESNGTSRTGKGYVVFGSSSAFPNPLQLRNLNSLNGFAINGESENDLSGFSVSTAGDFNADGIDDLIIGAVNANPNGNSNAGKSYVIFGSDSGLASPLNLDTINGLNGIVLNGESSGDYSGRSVSHAGDINGDGIDDLIIGAPGFDYGTKYDTGRSYIVFGSESGLSSPFNLSTLNGQNGFALSGVFGDEKSGTSVHHAGDVNADGIDDLIVGAPGFASNTGVAYILFGRPSVDLEIRKSNGRPGVATGNSTTWTIEIRNIGFADVRDAVLTDILPPEVDAGTAIWTCTASAGASCPNASGSGGLNETFDLSIGEELTYQLTANVIANEPAVVINTATVALDTGLTDLNPTNNRATDSDPIGLFSDGFESEF